MKKLILLMLLVCLTSISSLAVAQHNTGNGWKSIVCSEDSNEPNQPSVE